MSLDFCICDVNTDEEYWIRNLKTDEETFYNVIVEECLIGDIEGQYGSHNPCGVPGKYEGFNVYEIEPKDIPVLMKAWEDLFKSLNWL